MKKLFVVKASALAITSLLCTGAFARPNVPGQDGGGANGQGTSGGRTSALCLVGTAAKELDINNVRTTLLNTGDYWWDGNDARYEVPKLTDPTAPKKHSMFAGAVWLGGIDPSGNLRLAAQTYRQTDQGWFPGPLDASGQTEKSQCDQYDYMVKLNRSTLDEFKQMAANATGPLQPSQIDEAILKFPAKGNPFVNQYPLQLFDFEDKDGDGNYNPTVGDAPIMNGDQAVFWIMNDAGGNKKPTPASPIGMELQIQAFAFKTNDLVNNMTFYKQRLVNRGNIVLRDTYLGQWVDPDLGNYLDDFVGCDVQRGLGFCYNGDDNDEGIAGYGANPPAIGVDFFLGPLADACDGLDNDRDGKIDEKGERIVMSNFMYYNNDSSPKGNPNNPNDFYNYLTSKWKNGNNVTYGRDGYANAGQQYKFMFPGDTDLQQGYGYQTARNNPNCDSLQYVPGQKPTYAWTEVQAGNKPYDRRFLQSAGPFTLEQGQVNDLIVGVVWCQAKSGGAQGSLKLLLACDDQAQDLFDTDFQLPVGPNAPDLRIAELDQTLLLSIIPDKFELNGDSISTEDYVEFDKGLATKNTDDPYYRFEGYQVYQLKSNAVSESELDDPDRARLVLEASSDVKNGLTSLVNTGFDTDLGEIAATLYAKEATDQGIVHTARITRDLFAQGDDRLVNFKTYYYMVVAYASAKYRGSPGERFIQYRQGIRNVRKYAAIPHKVAPEGSVGSATGGTVLQADYGQLLPITRVYGIGNGGNFLKLNPESEQTLLAPPYHSRLVTYQAGNSPINVKIYDPKNVKADDFSLKLSSRLVYRKSDVTLGTSLSPGDTIEAFGNLRTLPNVPQPGKGNPSFYSKFPQAFGKARVNRIVSEAPSPTDPSGPVLVTLDVEMLNDFVNGTYIGGTFMYSVDSVIFQQDTVTVPRPAAKEVFQLYYNVPLQFRKIDQSFVSKTQNFVRNDFWKLTPKSTNEPIYSTRTLTDFNEQLIPEFGISLQLGQTVDPMFHAQELRTNGFMSANMKFANNQPWLEAIKVSEVDWLRSTDDATLKQLDPGAQYRLVMGGAFAPYEAVAQMAIAGNAGAYTFLQGNAGIFDLPNIDIVLTNDKSKWTRVPVLQVEQRSPCAHPGGAAQKIRLVKSTVPSVGKDGNPDNTVSPWNGIPSTGMGWFPGYAIDLDRGVRVNMMFAESRLEDPQNGDNLKWEPTSKLNGGRSYIYATSTVYDEGRTLESDWDRLLTDPNFFNETGCFKSLNVTTVNGFGNLVKEQIFNNVTWAGNLRSIPGKEFLPAGGDARIELRVTRSYFSYGGEPTQDNPNPSLGNDNPEYSFTTNGLASVKQDLNAAKDALSLIRVVPNPYYAYSDYEQKQVDNLVKITNLPPKCDITIYNLNGTVIRRFRKDDAATTWVDWNLQNGFRLPIASGTYIIHVDAGAAGSKVVKFFAIMRPIDTDTF